MCSVSFPLLRVCALLFFCHADNAQQNGVETQEVLEAELIESLKTRPIAEATRDANAQHYEVPTEFYTLCLGPRLKYSSGYYASAGKTLAQAEDAMFALYCERAQLVDGYTLSFVF